MTGPCRWASSVPSRTLSPWWCGGGRRVDGTGRRGPTTTRPSRLPRLLVPGHLVVARSPASRSRSRLCGEKIALIRDGGTRVRAARPLPAPRRPALRGRPAVPGHGQLPVPRLDLRPARPASSSPSSPTARTRRSAARSPCAPTRSRSASAWCGCTSRAPTRSRTRSTSSCRRSSSPTPSSWAAGSTTARRQLALRLRERLRRGPRQVPAPHGALAAVQDRCRPGTSPASCRRGRWIYRVQDEVHWEAEFPGVGRWTNKRWWKKQPPKETFNIGNTGKRRRRSNPMIEAQEFPGFASLSMPGVLRIAYPNFIHYEFYVPVDDDDHRYVGLMVNFVERLAGRLRSTPSTSARSAGCSTASSPARTPGWSTSPTRRRRSSTDPTSR